jgi:hypothetical protein
MMLLAAVEEKADEAGAECRVGWVTESGRACGLRRDRKVPGEQHGKASRAATRGNTSLPLSGQKVDRAAASKPQIEGWPAE